MPTKRFDDFRRALDERHASNRYRRPTTLGSDPDPAYVVLEGVRLINACSNDYLNLSRHEAVVEAVTAFARADGTGSTASRLVSGTRNCHTQFEDDFAKFLGRERALLFSSGYLANISIMPALVGRRDNIYIDRLAHHSLYQGALLSGAAMHRFRHNDLEHLNELLSTHSTGESRSLIVTEAIFSMDGDSPDIPTLCEIADRHDALLYIDEAHSFGITGESGRGMCHGNPRVDLVGSMFGKAMGGMGAAVACNDILSEYLIQHAGGFIYSTALPPPVVGGLQAALDVIPKMDQERSHLDGMQNMMRNGLVDAGFHVLGGASPIIPVVIGTETDTLSLAQHLRARGILAGAIRPPTVPAAQSRIRITLTAAHLEEHIRHVVDAFRSWEGASRP